MDGERITPESELRARVSSACARGVTGARLMAAIDEVNTLCHLERIAAHTEPLDSASWVQGVGYALLWLAGVREQTPSAYLASAREAGEAR